VGARPDGEREVVARHAVHADKRRGAEPFDPKDNMASPKNRFVLARNGFRRVPR